MRSEPPTAEQRKADAQADSAELDRDKKRLELEEWKARSTAREVEATAGIRTAVKEMTPDLSGVDRGSTTLPESGTIFQALLGGRALQDAASQVARSVKATCGDDYRVLVTTDLELAARDTRYLSAGQQLRHLAGLAARFRALDPAGAPVEGDTDAEAHSRPGRGSGSVRRAGGRPGRCGGHGSGRGVAGAAVPAFGQTDRQHQQCNRR